MPAHVTHPVRTPHTVQHVRGVYPVCEVRS
jgi:hypothetical protein